MVRNTGSYAQISEETQALYTQFHLDFDKLTAVVGDYWHTRGYQQTRTNERTCARQIFESYVGAGTVIRHCDFCQWCDCHC